MYASAGTISISRELSSPFYNVPQNGGDIGIYKARMLYNGTYEPR